MLIAFYVTRCDAFFQSLVNSCKPTCKHTAFQSSRSPPAFPSPPARPQHGTNRPQGKQRRHEFRALPHVPFAGSTPFPQDTSGEQQFIIQSLATARHRLTLCLWLDLPQLAMSSYSINQCVSIGLITVFVYGSACCHRLRFDLWTHTISARLTHVRTYGKQCFTNINTCLLDKENISRSQSTRGIQYWHSTLLHSAHVTACARPLQPPLRQLGQIISPVWRLLQKAPAESDEELLWKGRGLMRTSTILSGPQERIIFYTLSRIHVGDR